MADSWRIRQLFGTRRNTSPHLTGRGGTVKTMSPGSSAGTAVEVSFRRGEDLCERTVEWTSAAMDDLRKAAPWRTFRWYRGQKHYSGWYWSSTTRDLVIYESRLELANLMLADFDDQVRGIVAQPFLLAAEVDGVVRRHVPDFLLDTGTGPVVVDVKPARRLDNDDVARVLNLTRDVVEAKGWRYEVATEPPPRRAANVRFLAGYRRESAVVPDLCETVRAVAQVGLTIGDLIERIPDRPDASVRAAVLHLIWRRRLHVDIDAAITSRTQISGVL